MEMDMIKLQEKEEAKNANAPVEAANQAVSTIVRSAQGMKDHFMEIAQPLIDAYVNEALGKTGENGVALKSTSTHCREEVWDVLKKLMLQSSEKLDIMQGGSPEAIIKAVEGGKCTLEEGKELLSMYKQLRDIQDPTGKLTGGAAFQINIYSGDEGSPTEVIEVGGTDDKC